MSQLVTPKPLTRPPRRVRGMLDAIRGRYMHFDVVELYLNSSAPGLPIDRLDALCGGGALDRPGSPDHQLAWKYHLVLQQPSREALTLLLASLGSHRVLITKVEVTLDFRVKSKKIARKLQWALLTMMAVKSWEQKVVCAERTIYFGRRSKGGNAPDESAAAEGIPDVQAKTQAGDAGVDHTPEVKHRAAPKNYVIYVRRGKPGGPWEGKRCLRLEARFRGKAALEGIGITTVHRLLDFDHAQFWLDHVKLLVPLSLAQAGKRFPAGKVKPKVSRTMRTRRGHSWQEQFLVEGHFCMQNAVLVHRELWADLDHRWTAPVLFGSNG